MKIASEYVNQVLMAYAPLQAVINGKHYWELAGKNEKGSFIVYRLVENIIPTKQSREFVAKIYCFGTSLTEAAEVSELVKEAFDGKGYFRGGTSGFTDDEKKEGFIELNINFKTR